jgi:hypothetical protein
MFCPVDGEEFVEGFEQCPEHEVDLLEEPPAWLAEGVARLQELRRLRTIRLPFFILLGAATIYAIGGLMYGILGANAEVGGDVSSDLFSQLRVIDYLTKAAFRVGLGAFGLLAGAALLQTLMFLNKGKGSSSDDDGHSTEDDDVEVLAVEKHGLLMQLMFALTVGFGLLYAVSGVIRLLLEEHPNGLMGFPEQSDAYWTFSALQGAAIVCGIATFGVMAGILVMRAYALLTNSRFKDPEMSADGLPR